MGVFPSSFWWPRGEKMGEGGLSTFGSTAIASGSLSHGHSLDIKGYYHCVKLPKGKYYLQTFWPHYVEMISNVSVVY